MWRRYDGRRADRVAAQRFGVLLITVWPEDGTLVARFRGCRGDGGSSELRPAAGSSGIVAAVSCWLHDIEFPDTDPEEGAGSVTTQ